MALIKTPGGEFFLEDSQFNIDYEKNIVTMIGGGGGQGGSDANYVFNQRTPSNHWDIVHNLNKFPSVTIVDSGGNIVIGEVDYVNKNSVAVTFSGAFSGSAYLN